MGRLPELVVAVLATKRVGDRAAEQPAVEGAEGARRLVPLAGDGRPRRDARAAALRPKLVEHIRLLRRVRAHRVRHIDVLLVHVARDRVRLGARLGEPLGEGVDLARVLLILAVLLLRRLRHERLGGLLEAVEAQPPQNVEEALGFWRAGAPGRRERAPPGVERAREQPAARRRRQQRAVAERRERNVRRRVRRRRRVADAARHRPDAPQLDGVGRGVRRAADEGAQRRAGQRRPRRALRLQRAGGGRRTAAAALVRPPRGGRRRRRRAPGEIVVLLRERVQQLPQPEGAVAVDFMERAAEPLSGGVDVVGAQPHVGRRRDRRVAQHPAQLGMRHARLTRRRIEEDCARRLARGGGGQHFACSGTTTGAADKLVAAFWSLGMRSCALAQTAPARAEQKNREEKARQS